MKLIMTDKDFGFSTNDGDIAYVDLSKKKVANCVGCYGCWTKTPGRCVIRDDAATIYPLIAKSDSVIYVTHVKYGGYDQTMKAMLERAIPIQQAFIRLVDGETHHVQRDVRPKKALIVAYGTTDGEERALFGDLVRRNAKNMNFSSHRIVFCDEGEIPGVVRKEVEEWKRS